MAVHPHLLSPGYSQIFLFLQLCEGLQLGRCLLHLVDMHRIASAPSLMYCAWDGWYIDI